MDHKQCSRLRVLAVGLLAACSFGASSALAELAAAKVDVKEIMGLDGISWEAPATYRSASLVVTGPAGFRMERTFKAGEPLFLDFAAIAKEASPDGRYKYELVLSPLVSARDKALAEEARAIGEEVGFLAEKPLGSRSGVFTLAAGNPVDRDLPETTLKDFVINDDLIVDGSACIGFDCVNGEVFGFDTLKLKENNLRIKFDDTSSTASFPDNDWQITINDSANGGAEKFSIDDISNGRTPFTIEAAAPSHSLYVDDGGRIGLGTSTPVVEVHIVDGDTPTLRLEQDGSSGFTPQTWDVAGNETNFFIRDVTNGSRLPLRIRPNAPSNSIFVDPEGDVGFNTSSPDSNAQVHIVSDGSNRGALRVERNGNVALVLEDSSATNVEWTFGTDADGDFNIALTGLGVIMQIDDATGNITCRAGSNINGVACTGL